MIITLHQLIQNGLQIDWKIEILKTKVAVDGIHVQDVA